MNVSEFLLRHWGSRVGIVSLEFGHGPHFDERGKYQHEKWEPYRVAWPTGRDRVLQLIAGHADRSDVYFAPLLRRDTSRRKDAGNALPGRYAWVDVDGEWAPQREATWQRVRVCAPGSILVGSGRGAHVYVDLGGYVDIGELEAWNRRLRDAFSGDAKWAENTVLRPPGTLNHKTRVDPAVDGSGTATPVEILVEPGEGDTDLRALDALLPPDPQPGGRHGPRGPRPHCDPIEPGPIPEDVSDDVRRLLEEEPGEDNSGKLYHLVMTAAEDGHTDEEIAGLALAHQPGLTKWGGDREKVVGDVAAILAKERRKHDHAGRRCDEARCSNTPPRMKTRGSMGTSAGRKTSDADVAASLNLTDLGNANRLLNSHGGDLRYCPSLGWHVWDGTRWKRDELGQVFERAKRTAVALYTEAAVEDDDDKRKAIVRWARQSESKTHIVAMVTLAQTDPRVAVPADVFDADPWLLNVANGTVDLRTGKLRDHDPTDRITKLAPAHYDPEATSQLWDDFLRRVLPDRDVRDYVQRLAGYGAAGVSRGDVLPIFHGLGANGKSTLLEAWRSVLGDYAVAADPNLLLEAKHEEHPTQRARLRGARLVTTVEVNRGRRFNEAMVKQLTGGDRMTGRFMRQDYFEFDPTWLIVLAANHRPAVRGTEEAIWRRVSLVPFSVTIPPDERDDTLRERLAAEAGPAILAWIVKGCLDWQESGLRPPAGVLAATAAYRGEMDDIGRFLDERCEPQAGHVVLFVDLYRAFMEWAARGDVEPVSKKLFGMTLTEKGHPGEVPTSGVHKKQAVRHGLRLKPKDPSGDQPADVHGT